MLYNVVTYYNIAINLKHHNILFYSMLWNAMTRYHSVPFMMCFVSMHRVSILVPWWFDARSGSSSTNKSDCIAFYIIEYYILWGSLKNNRILAAAGMEIQWKASEIYYLGIPRATMGSGRPGASEPGSKIVYSHVYRLGPTHIFCLCSVARVISASL